MLATSPTTPMSALTIPLHYRGHYTQPPGATGACDGPEAGHPPPIGAAKTTKAHATRLMEDSKSPRASAAIATSAPPPSKRAHERRPPQRPRSRFAPTHSPRRAHGGPRANERIGEQ